MAAKKKTRKRPARKKVARRPGRPTKYSKALTARLCAQLAQGKSLRTVCKMDGMPYIATVYLWFPKYPEFIEQYEKAIGDRTDAHIEDMLDIADNQNEDAQSRRIRIDVRKWIASKLKPRKYGDKIEVSGDPDRPVITKIINELV